MLKHQESYDIMNAINEACQKGEISKEKRKECIDAELKFLENEIFKK